jgi:hypothetical protein
VPIIEWRGGPLARVSIQGYNTLDDVEAPITALRVLLRKVQTLRRSGSRMGTGAGVQSWKRSEAWPSDWNEEGWAAVL